MIFIPDSILAKDSEGNFICPKCRKLEYKCACLVNISKKGKELTSDGYVYLAKNNRTGKTVTIVKGLNPNEDNLKKQCKEIKSKLGCGGTYYISGGIGCLEIQGEHQLKVNQIIKGM